MKYKNTSEWGKDKAAQYSSGGSVSTSKKDKDVKPLPLTPDSNQFNPDSPTGRFPTKSPRP